MTKPDTLVVTPTLGTRPTLPKTMTSVREIGGERVHHILVCPESRVSSIQDQFPGVEVVAEAAGKGIYTAVNQVFRQYAQDYKYIAYINDDDFWLPGFADLFKILDVNDKLDACYGKVRFVNNDGSTRYDVAHTNRWRAFAKLIAHGIPGFTQQAVLMRSGVFKALGGFDEQYKIVADSDFWIRCVKAGIQFQSSNSMCAGYCIQEGQISGDVRLRREEHDRMAASHRLGKSVTSYIEVLLFRIRNAKNYATRFLKKKMNAVSTC